MNNIYLYRQILKGKWFIHYSYALSLAPLLRNLFEGKSMGDIRDWNNNQTNNLENSEGREQFPVMAGSSASGVSVFSKYDDAPEGSVALVPLKSVMVKYGTLCEYGTEEIAGFMLSAAASKKISAIVLDIDSGGGSVDSIPPMLEAIRKIQVQYNKPVVAMADLCASAAYFVAAHCDRIIANNNLSSEFGSIGVMMQWWDVQPYYEKEGYVFHKIYAPESSYKNLPFEKALKGDYDMIKEEELSPLAIGFQNAIKTKRGSKLDLKIEGILNGRMFYAENQKNPKLSAKDVGLIDEVADLERAISLAKELAEMKEIFSEI
ncbi:MAG TPA: S49 family peptidase [Candidatus Cloacimonadota bacterium]|nr:S49 family peptidase [Candidatus Cloacimonadota bacterium]HPS38830.1 S49 family peptidase [Candidatus Cloacimonadota bacterium]